MEYLVILTPLIKASAEYRLMVVVVEAKDSKEARTKSLEVAKVDRKAYARPEVLPYEINRLYWSKIQQTRKRWQGAYL